MKKSLCKTFKISKHKFLEFQFDLGWKFNTADSPFRLSFEIKQKTDHAGWDFNFGMFCLFNFIVSFYDSRHWNYEKERFFLPNEEKAENTICRRTLEKIGFKLIYNDGLRESYYHDMMYLNDEKKLIPMFTILIDNHRKNSLISYDNFNARYQRNIKDIFEVKNFINFFTSS